MNSSRNDADVAFIKALAELLNENDLSEISVKRDYGADDSLNVRVSRQIAAPAPTAQNFAPAPVAPVGTEIARGPAATGDPRDHPGAVASPMVGTAYLSAEPGAPAFVSIGQQVAEGETLMIIEAMKTMNQIPAPRAGTVKRILVTDGSPVEYGAPLMIVE